MTKYSFENPLLPQTHIDLFAKAEPADDPAELTEATLVPITFKVWCMAIVIVPRIFQRAGFLWMSTWLSATLTQQLSGKANGKLPSWFAFS
ncbi:hypothetical protein [Burkholderia sp. SRS-W-2-2016]|uniref:hypothetical protein n=1 Tax=Burkholderia sp. SRS-W-2-2016 TaxID=1926878 RepID=UPI000B000A83|nr:hypothetical protein [Burkholderia sp. SRS-W-2-2016]